MNFRGTTAGVGAGRTRCIGSSRHGEAVTPVAVAAVVAVFG